MAGDSVAADTVIINVYNDTTAIRGSQYENDHTFSVMKESDIFVYDENSSTAYSEEIQKAINAIDELAVFSWLIVDLPENYRASELKYGVGSSLGELGKLTRKDQMLNLNGILADLQMQMVSSRILKYAI